MAAAESELVRSDTQLVLGHTLAGLSDAGTVAPTRIAGFIRCVRDSCEKMFNGKVPVALSERLETERKVGLCSGNLNLTDCDITDTICKALRKALIQHPIVRHLCLQDNPLTVTGVRFILDAMVKQVHAYTEGEFRVHIEDYLLRRFENYKMMSMYRAMAEAERDQHDAKEHYRRAALYDAQPKKTPNDGVDPVTKRPEDEKGIRWQVAAVVNDEDGAAVKQLVRAGPVRSGPVEEKGEPQVQRLLPIRTAPSIVLQPQQAVCPSPRIAQALSSPDFDLDSVVCLLQEVKLSTSAMCGVTANARLSVMAGDARALRQQTEASRLPDPVVSLSEMIGRVNDVAQIALSVNKLLEGDQCFMMFEKDANGNIGEAEFSRGLLSTMKGQDDKALIDIDVKKHFEAIDTDGNGEISRDEFLTSIAELAKLEARTLRVRDDFLLIVVASGATIDPTSKFMQGWNVAMMFALGYVTLVTPFETSFMGSEPMSYDMLFWCNRAIDTLFLVDMVLCFITWYPDPRGLGYIKRGPKIRSNYLKGWFVVDLMSAVPFDVIAGVVAMNDTTGSSNQLVGLRLVRLMRLLKLARVFRAGRLHARLAIKLEKVSNNVLAVVEVITIIIIMSHWLSCLWMFCTGMETLGHDSWIIRGAYHTNQNSPWEAYLVCLYYTLQTMTTIGYGDVVNPSTSWEFVMACLAMMFGSIFWAYIIAQICTIIQAMNLRKNYRRGKMDDLKEMMHELGLEPKLRDRLRDYFRHRQRLLTLSTNQNLFHEMSPALHGDVAQFTHREHFSKISWLKNAATPFVSAVALQLEPLLFSPWERIVADHFHLIVKGVAVKDSNVLCQGCMWGLDMVMHNNSLKRLNPAAALTFLFVLRLTKDGLEKVLCTYPHERVNVRRAAGWMAFRRKFLRHAHDTKILTEEIVSMLRTMKRDHGYLRQVFDEADEDNKGYLTLGDLKTVLVNLGIDASTEVFEEIMRRFDADGSRSVSVSEFLDFFDLAGDDIPDAPAVKVRTETVNAGGGGGLNMVDLMAGRHTIDQKQSINSDPIPSARISDPDRPAISTAELRQVIMKDLWPEMKNLIRDEMTQAREGPNHRSPSPVQVVRRLPVIGGGAPLSPLKRMASISPRG